jgi:hypothetical protein
MRRVRMSSILIKSPLGDAISGPLDAINAWSKGYSATRHGMNQFPNVVKNTLVKLRHVLDTTNAQAIAVRGTSGLCIAFAARMIDNLPFVMVRKEENNLHHGLPIESLTGNSLNFRRYIFLDDFISSGSTMRAVETALLDAECVAAVLYDGGGMSQSIHRADPPVWRELPMLNMRGNPIPVSRPLD